MNLKQIMSIKNILLIILSVSSLNVLSADASAGKGHFAKCIACHGDQGQGNAAQNAPRLAGQHDWYIVSSLQEFKSGVRKNAVMLPFIKNLSDKDFQDLAAYISSMK